MYSRITLIQHPVIWNLNNLALQQSTPKTGSFAFYQKTGGIRPNPLSPTPTASAMKTPENRQQGPVDPNPADQGDIQMEYSSDFTAQI
jgi:hypothetical protein